MLEGLRILGGPKQVCSGVTRRELLLAGSAALGGWPLAAAQHRANAEEPVGAAETSSADLPGFGRAKNLILLYLFGGPSHLETFDPKPDAPAEVRGEIASIESSLSGCRVSEGLPRAARQMHRVSVVRSLNHPWNFHGMMWATTGVTEGSIPLEETQHNPLHWPYLGSVVHFLRQQSEGAKPAGAVPDNLMLPWLLSSRRPAIPYARAHGSFLGSQYDPLWMDFRGAATKSVPRWSFGPKADVADPNLGITPESRFEFLPEMALPAEVTLDRLEARRSLLEQLEFARRDLDASPVRRLYELRRTAYGLIDAPAMQEALELEREPAEIREAYGMTLFGQATLQARRLVEAGCRFVTVVWDEFGQLNTGWDTHVDHHGRLRNELLPGFDAAYSRLLDDLSERGLLDETLVCVMNEMGRTPRLEGDGRGHWGRAYSNVFAGGGIAQGRVIGRTDQLGASVDERPVSAKDVLATLYHLLGFDPRTLVSDRLGRPLPLVHGEIIPELLA